MQNAEQSTGRNITLAFRIRVIGLAREIVIDWLRGSDRVLYESFCGLIHRNSREF
jgi:23S rRNA (adenine1618-N6)-methyltransferase